jgi:hypothetical protein
LDNQRRADIGTEHDGESRHEIDETARCEGGHKEARRRAALEQRSHSNAGQQG